ncbi:hypothetical protein Dip518_000174 [Parelusimicrobium proximum]|uniref:hypothetical protein n=1 Tax=Parelusimicrobium proximum TaxID=3228953 RepID=UPI003D1720E2
MKTSTIIIWLLATALLLLAVAFGIYAGKDRPLPAPPAPAATAQDYRDAHDLESRIIPPNNPYSGEPLEHYAGALIILEELVKAEEKYKNKNGRYTLNLSELNVYIPNIVRVAHEGSDTVIYTKDGYFYRIMPEYVYAQYSNPKTYADHYAFFYSLRSGNKYCVSSKPSAAERCVSIGGAATDKSDSAEYVVHILPLNFPDITPKGGNSESFNYALPPAPVTPSVPNDNTSTDPLKFYAASIEVLSEIVKEEQLYKEYSGSYTSSLTDLNRYIYGTIGTSKDSGVTLIYTDDGYYYKITKDLIAAYNNNPVRLADLYHIDFHFNGEKHCIARNVAAKERCIKAGGTNPGKNERVPKWTIYDLPDDFGGTAGK